MDALEVDGHRVLTWDEAVEREITLPEFALDGPVRVPAAVPGGEDVEPVTDAGGGLVGRIVRRRWALTARLRADVEADDGFLRLTVAVDNHAPGPGRPARTPRSASR